MVASSTGSPKTPRRHACASGRYHVSTRSRAADTAPPGRPSADGCSTVTTAPPPSRATRDSRTSSASIPPGTPVTTTSANPPDRSSSSAAASADSTEDTRAGVSRLFNRLLDELFNPRPRPRPRPAGTPAPACTRA